MSKNTNPDERLIGSRRKKVQAELDYYLAALNIDTQFAVRKAVFLTRVLFLPGILTVKEALYEIEKQLALNREKWNFGRPWSYMQLRRAYWTKAKGFKRAAPYPMTPEEYAGFKKREAPKRMLQGQRKLQKRLASERIAEEDARMERARAVIEKAMQRRKRLEARVEAG